MGWWLTSSSVRELAIQNPGADNRPQGSARSLDQIKIGEHFMHYADLEPSTATGKWSRFRGADFSNIITNETIEARDFKTLWTISTGEGHAAPVIYNGRVYLLDYDEALSSDMLRCFSLESGTELWRRWYRVPMKRNHGFSRTIPVVTDNYVITISPMGHIMCCDPITGDLIWTLDQQSTFKAEVPFWYTGQCPLMDGENLIIAPCGDSVMMAALDVATGEIRWSLPNDRGLKMSHSSILPMTLGGQRQYLYMAIGGTVGVSPEGRQLWFCNNEWQPAVIAPSPLKIGNNKVLLTAGYGAGSALLELQGSTAKITQTNKPNQGIASEQQTPILFNNLIYTVLPKDGGANRGKLVIFDPSDLKNPIWSSANDERFGLGPYIIIGDKIMVFEDQGALYTYIIEGRELKLVHNQKIIDGADAWGPIAYANDRLLVRDAHTVICLDTK